MNILPKDVINYIYRIIHTQRIEELNKEFLNSTEVCCDNDDVRYLYWELGYNNKPFNYRWLDYYICHSCYAFGCNQYCKIHIGLPKRYYFSSGNKHPFAYK